MSDLAPIEILRIERINRNKAQLAELSLCSLSVTLSPSEGVGQSGPHDKQKPPPIQKLRKRASRRIADQVSELVLASTPVHSEEMEGSTQHLDDPDDFYMLVKKTVGKTDFTNRNLHDFCISLAMQITLKTFKEDRSIRAKFCKMVSRQMFPPPVDDEQDDPYLKWLEVVVDPLLDYTHQDESNRQASRGKTC
jgi:hypothetical protein